MEISSPIRARALRVQPRTDAESRVAEMATRRRLAAEQGLRRALGGYDLSQIAQSLDDAVMALADVDPEFLAAVIEEGTWDEYLASHCADHPYFARAQAGIGTVPSDERVVRVSPPQETIIQTSIIPGALMDSLEHGQTYVIHRLDQYDQGALSGFVEDLETAFGNMVGVNVYVSRNGATGFGAHWDDHHVLILQVRGEKMWEVFQPDHLAPDRGYIDRHAAGPPVWSGVLRPGQALVIPRGWSHGVVGLDELSIHYTISFSGTTFRSVFSAISDALPDGAGSDFDVRSWLESELADPFPYLEQTAALPRVTARPRARTGVELVERWVAEGADPARLRVLLPGVAVFHGDAPEGGGVNVAWNNTVVHLSADDVEALVALPKGTEATTHLGRQLLAAGLARIEAP